MEEERKITGYKCEYCGKEYSIEKCFGKKDLAREACRLHELAHENGRDKTEFIRFIDKLKYIFPKLNFRRENNGTYVVCLTDNYFDAGEIQKIFLSNFVENRQEYEKKIIKKLKVKNDFYTGVRCETLRFTDADNYGDPDDIYINLGNHTYENFNTICYNVRKIRKKIKVVVVDDK